MNKHMPASNWDRPSPSPDFLLKHPKEDVDAWTELRDKVVEIATANNWRKTEVAKRVQMPDATFSQWVSGLYLGVLANQNRIVGNWVEALQENSAMAAAIPTSPAFLRTRVASDIIETLTWAQMTAGFVVVTLDAGVGKTTACRHYCATRPHAYLATVSPNTKTTHGMLVELAAELDVQEHNPAKLTRAIGRKLQRIGDGSLLIVDEAQNLVPEAINQLRHFVDINRCGVALVGNEETADRFVKSTGSVASKGQVRSRIDKRLAKERNRGDDARQYIAAWGIEDGKCIEFLLLIAQKPGALRQIDRTVKLALWAANGAGEPLSLKHLKWAWSNRDLGDMA
ncbi:AAA family ATPase [Sinorhizobium medicae]|uniref:AAA family ATPase n=1 Tax=Sinorhizobium medicae TaxID=110321 RepID=UPI0004175B72|nr:AAA family ATPase [Sinorhizobium medicae]RVQ76142.1 DNA transposition protein [Sinorhizobium medicae]